MLRSVLLSCFHSSITKAMLLFLLTCQFIILCIFIQPNLQATMTQLQLITPTEPINKIVLQRTKPQPLKQRVDKEPLQAALAQAIEATNKTSQQRVKHIRAYCKDHGTAVLSQNPDYDRTGQRLTNWIWMVSNHHKLFYCATPKCGSTTWKSYLMEDLGIDWKIDTHE